MHHGKPSDLPGACFTPPSWGQISCILMKTFDDCVIVAGNDSLFLLPLVVWGSKTLWSGLHQIPGSGSSMIWWCNCAHWHRKPRERERFQNIMINNSSDKWNYSSVCSFLVNWILEKNYSQNCNSFRSRVIIMGFWVIMILIVFISPWFKWMKCSITLLATAPL